MPMAVATDRRLDGGAATTSSAARNTSMMTKPTAIVMTMLKKSEICDTPTIARKYQANISAHPNPATSRMGQAIRATAQGLCYNAGRATSALAPLAIGWLADRHGLGAALASTAGLYVVGGALIFLLPETRGEELA